MTYEEMRKFALEHYNEGGDSFYECWEDYQIQEWLDEFFPPNPTPKMIKSAMLRMFGMYESVTEDIQGA